MRYLIERESRTRFDSPVREHHVLLRVAPLNDNLQHVRDCSLALDPAMEPASHRDGFGNQVHRFGIMSAHDHLTTRLQVEVETLLANPFDFEPVPAIRERTWIEQSLHEAPRLWDFLVHRNPYTPGLPEAIANRRVPVYNSNLPLLGQVQDTMAWIIDFCELDQDCMVPQPKLANLFERRCGGPPDLAHLLISVVRGWGIPARYVIGYLDPSYFEPDEEKDGEDAEPRPQTMHAWAEVLVPGANWRGFDPTTGLLADETYIRVAVGRNAGDVMTERMVCKGDAGSPDTLVNLKLTRLD